MTHQPSWHMVGQSVRGASHRRTGLPNQDALACLPPDADGPPLILALSDGHGSAKSFRSDRGSRFAVDATVALMQELVSGRPATPNLSAIKRVSEEKLPQELVRRWQEAVDADLQKEPFTEDELARLAAQRGPADQQAVLDNPRLAYGATVLSVLVERDFLLYLQLGDGDILVVSDQGAVARPFDRDSRLIANETTSLCMDRAWREVRLRFQTRYGPPPALILVATDGYANSFVNDGAFLRVGSDILDILKREGVATVKDSLEGWLSEASEAGSGDDITVGLLIRRDALGKAVAETASSASVTDHTDAASTNAEPRIGAEATDDATVDPTAREPDRDPALRSRLLAQLKHKGPTEPSKQGRLMDLVETEADDETAD